MRKIVVNTGAQMIGRVVGAFCAFLSTILLAQYLGVSFFGEYTKVIAYTSLFYPFVDFGINTLYLRLYAKRVEQELRMLLTLRLIMAAVLSTLATVFAVILGLVPVIFSFSQLPTIVLATTALFAYGVILTTTVIYQVRARYDLGAIGSALGSAATLIILYIFMQNGGGQGEWRVFMSVGALVAGLFITAVWGLTLFPTHKAHTKPNRGAWKVLLVASLPLGATLLFNIVYFKVDTLILSLFRTSHEVGVYGLAYRFFEFALVLPTFIMNSLYPDLLKSGVGERLLSRFKAIMAVFFVLSLVIGGAIWFAAPLLALMRNDFVESVTLLRILALELPLFYVTSPLMWWYVLVNKPKVLALFYGVTMVSNIILNFVFIPRWGSIGAAIVTGITEAIVLLLGVSYLYFYHYEKRS